MIYRSLIILFAFLFVSGCNTGRVSVTGTVKYDDGSPVELGFVKFVGDTTQATAKIGPGGRFTLGELKKTDGIKPGRYKVVVAGVEIGGGSTGAPLTRYIDKKYGDPATSGLSCDVQGAMTFDITVEKHVTTTQPRPQPKKPTGRP